MTHKVTIAGNVHWIAGMIILAALALPFAGIAHADNGKNKANMKAGTGVEVNIGGNGGVLVRGAKVTSVSGSTVHANTSLGSSVLSWVIKTGNDTEFVTSNGANTGLGGIAIGDTVSFRGSLDQSQSGLTVTAKVLKDWSQVETRKTLSGVVTAINTTLNSFIVSKDNSSTTVQTSSSTKFTEDGDAASFVDIVLNAKVKIAGFFNASSSVLTANSVEIDADDDDDRGWFRGRGWFKFW